MANFHGKIGFVHWGQSETTIPEVLNWSLSATVDVADETVMQDATKTYLAGFKEWTATVECSAPAADGPTIPFETGDGPDVLTTGLGADVSVNTTQLVLYTVYIEEIVDPPADGEYKYVWGTAICTGIAYNVDVNDVGKLAYTFQGHNYLQVGSGASPKKFEGPDII